MSVEFQDFSVKIKNVTEEAAIRFLEEASAEIESQAKRNSRVKTGQTKGSFTHIVDDSKKESQIGSPLENALWEELGTGEHALNGDGRKGGWFYVDDEGEGHFTHGKKPSRALYKAFVSKKGTVKRIAEKIFGELGK